MRIRSIHRSSYANERGAVLAMATVGVVMALIAAALSVDIGSQAWKKRDLQKVADLAALDASWVIPEVQAGEHASPTQAAQWAAEDSADRNGLDLGLTNADVIARLGDWDREDRTFTECGMGFAPAWLGGLNGAVTNLNGTLSGLSGADYEDALRDFIWTDAGIDVADHAIDLGDCEPNAVKVRAEDTARRYFMPGATDPMVAAAGVAAFDSEPWPIRESWAVFTIGSFAARAQDVSGSAAIAKLLEAFLDPDDTPVSLDDQSSLELVSYNGLANANVTLGAILRGVRDAGIEDTSVGAGGTGRIGTVDELLALEMTAPEFLSVMAHALRRMDPDDDGNVDGYPGLAAEVEVLEEYASSFGYGGTTFQLLNILRVGGNEWDEETDEDGNVTRSDAQAFSLELNALNLIMAGAMAANGENAVTLTGSSLLPAGLGSATLSFTVIEPPVTAMGPVGTVAQTAQIRGTMLVELADQFTVVGEELGGLLDDGNELLDETGEAINDLLGSDEESLHLDNPLVEESSAVVIPFEVRAVQATARLDDIVCDVKDTLFNVVNQLVDADADLYAGHPGIADLLANLQGGLTDVLDHDLMVALAERLDGINVLEDDVLFHGDEYPQTAVVSNDLAAVLSDLLADVNIALDLSALGLLLSDEEVNELEADLIGMLLGVQVPVRELLERFSIVGSDLTVDDVVCEGEIIGGLVSGIPVLVQ